MSTTRVLRLIRGTRSAVYRALLDPDAVQRWMVPDGMTSEVHTFDAHEGGAFRISLTYEDPVRTGKTAARTDTFHGRFARLDPDREVVQVVTFETDDPSMQGEMAITYRLEDDPAGTLLTSTHEGLPPGVSPDDNVMGTTMSMAKLAALVEAE